MTLKLITMGHWTNLSPLSDVPFHGTNSMGFPFPWTSQIKQYIRLRSASNLISPDFVLEHWRPSRYPH